MPQVPRVCSASGPEGQLSTHPASNFLGWPFCSYSRPFITEGDFKTLIFPYTLIRVAKGPPLLLHPDWQGSPFLLFWGLSADSSFFSFFLLSLCTCSVSLFLSPAVEFISRKFMPIHSPVWTIMSVVFRQHHHDFWVPAFKNLGQSVKCGDLSCIPDFEWWCFPTHLLSIFYFFFFCDLPIYAYYLISAWISLCSVREYILNILF